MVEVMERCYRTSRERHRTFNEGVDKKFSGGGI